jgi:hypothetical protein
LKHLKSYQLFESFTRPESSNQEIDYDRLYSDINDICQDVIDTGLEVNIGINDYKKVDNALCTDVVLIGIHIPSENFLTDKGSFLYGDIKETFDRIIDYLKMFGYDNHKFKVFNFGGNPIFKDFDGDVKESSSSFRLILYKSIDHIIESKTTPKLKFNKQPRKKGAKTDVYNVVKNGTTIGQVKWYSRLRGYGFLPPSGDESEVKEFVKEISRLRREEKKKNK